MSTIFLIHGLGGVSKGNWFSWIEKKLTDQGHQVIIPQFPTPEGQTLENWLAILEPLLQDEEPPIFIAHSLGVPFVLNVLEKHKAKAAFFVAGFTGKIDHHYDPSLSTFAQREFDWESILQNCPHFEIFHSDNDPYVHEKKAEELYENLKNNKPQLHWIAGGGHLNSKAGFKTFELLLERVQSIVSSD